jgi:hypothetical protein
MKIVIDNSPKPVQIKIDKPDAVVELKARKTMAGDIMIFDHPDIDIMVSPSKNKIFALSKDRYGDHIYATQSRLFEWLRRHGIVDPSKTRGGNVFGSLESTMLIPEEKQKDKVSPVDVAVYSIAKFLHEEAPSVRAYKEYENNFDKLLTEPSDEDTTRLGKIPHEPRQGTNNTYPGSTAAYGLVGYYYEE